MDDELKGYFDAILSNQACIIAILKTQAKEIEQIKMKVILRG